MDEFGFNPGCLLDDARGIWLHKFPIQEDSHAYVEVRHMNDVILLQIKH